MLTRRRFLQTATVFTGTAVVGAIVAGCGANMIEQGSDAAWFMPEEGDPHARTWMAFGASERIWGRRLLPEVRRNLIMLAQTIARYEPVSMLVREHEYEVARELIGSSTDAPIELIRSPLDDLWIRDTGPTFVLTAQGEKAAVDFNFNGWGEKQEYGHDAQVAGFVANQAGVTTLHTDLVLEGGCIEVDGHGTAVITESCVLNRNRNPGVSKAAFEDQLMPLLGLEKIIWLPGIRGRDITDGHTDFYARFAKSGVILAGYDPDPASFDHEVTQAHLEILHSATDAQGRSLEVIVLEGPSIVRERYETVDFAAGYIGFYVCNGAVIMQEFGDSATDRAAKQALERAFPEREIVQLTIDGIAAGGGSIHCATQQEPLAN